MKSRNFRHEYLQQKVQQTKVDNNNKQAKYLFILIIIEY